MSNYSPALEKIAAKNIQKWVLAEHARERMKVDSGPEELGPVLTISREAGVPAHETAELVAKKLGWDLMDREIIEVMAEEYGTTDDMVKAFDERNVGFMEGIFESWIEGLPFSGSNYFESLKRLFFVAANHGKVIIVGRGAQFVLPAESTFSVRLFAPLETCVEHVMKERNLDQKHAKAEVQKTDGQRKDYVRSHFHKDLKDPINFDLLINCQRITSEDASEIIATAVRKWHSD